ncbi:MAG TPA: hypothetical protein VF071_04995 [Candidatus Limnocylindria bacterium]
MGKTHTGTQTTQINSDASITIAGVSSHPSGNGLRGTSSGTTSTAVYGFTGGTGATGVRGAATSNTGQTRGVDGYAASPDGVGSIGRAWGNGTGILGHSGSTNPPAAKPKTGVYGHATQDGGSRGVWGRSNAGQGVRGQATSGVGLYGTATNGFALRTSGRLKADKVSGVATIPAGSTGVTISPGVNVTSSSFVLLTPRANIGSRGLWYVPNTTANTFRIRMSSSRSSNTKVAWLLLG